MAIKVPTPFESQWSQLRTYFGEDSGKLRWILRKTHALVAKRE
jgi:hypothetical protein